MNKAVLDNYRIERKFIIPFRLTYSIEEVLKSNSALMRKIFYPRFINNIYFDNSRFQFFFENIDENSFSTAFCFTVILLKNNPE